MSAAIESVTTMAELLQAKRERDAFAIWLQQISGFADAQGNPTPEARMAKRALEEAKGREKP